MEKVAAVPSSEHVPFGGGGAVSMFPFTIPMLLPVSVYVHPTPASWNPVTSVEAAVVPMSPLITVSIPWLVMPALPPKVPNVAAAPKFGASCPSVVPVMKVHGFGVAPAINGLPATSVAALLIVAV